MSSAHAVTTQHPSVYRLSRRSRDWARSVFSRELSATVTSSRSPAFGFHSPESAVNAWYVSRTTRTSDFFELLVVLALDSEKPEHAVIELILDEGVEG